MDKKDQWQVCSLELSKRLKELGYPQKGLWWWAPKQDGSYGVVCDRNNNGDTGVTIFIKRDCVAPTVAELGERLPDRFFSYRREDKGWQVGDKVKDCWNIWAFGGDTEAEARGQMLAYLKENGLLKEKRDDKEK